MIIRLFFIATRVIERVIKPGATRDLKERSKVSTKLGPRMKIKSRQEPNTFQRLVSFRFFLICF
ncbi:hypothetical protein HanPSC8_Chr17g0797341 [Helianthus annuus]|nr:hypothetical protein HanPSC8_Chr17g0797341 [Helianthus annuus]